MKTTILALALTGAALLATAQQPTVVNAHFHSGPAGPGLSATVDRFRGPGERLWLGYQVQALPGTHLSACSSWPGRQDMEAECCSEYRLEEPEDHLNFSGHDGESSVVNVLLRVDNRAITRVLAVPVECKLDAGGLRFEWLEGVQAEESVSFLGELAAKENMNAKPEKKVADGSLVALALHATPKATDELAKLSDPGQPRELREKAAFWLGAKRGHDGLIALHQLLKSETDPELRKKLVFDVSVNSDPEAVDDLLQMAKADPDSEVRGQAIFWLAQKAGKKAVGAITDAAENDPDVAVKKKAVFALSQLPKDESIPQLERVANTSSSPEVRKAAIFWLGQTNDPRALAYLEDLLKH